LYKKRKEKILITLINPRHLNRFEDFFVTAIGRTNKPWQGKNPISQVGEAKVNIIRRWVMLLERDCNIAYFMPIHRITLFYYH
jgi:hypothetical protein